MPFQLYPPNFILEENSFCLLKLLVAYLSNLHVEFWEKIADDINGMISTELVEWLSRLQLLLPLEMFTDSSVLRTFPFSCSSHISPELCILLALQ